MLSATETKRLMRRLNIYNDQNHPHKAQVPIEIDIATFGLRTQFINNNIQLT